MSAAGLTLAASAFPGNEIAAQRTTVLSPRMHECIGMQNSEFIFDQTFSTLDEFVVAYDDGSEYPLGLRVGEDGVLLDPQWLNDEAVRSLVRQGKWVQHGNKMLRMTQSAGETCDLAKTLMRRLRNDFSISASGNSPAILNEGLLGVGKRLDDLGLLVRSRTKPFAADVGFQAGDCYGDWNGTFQHANVNGTETSERTIFEKHLLERGAVLRASSGIEDLSYCSIDNVDEALFVGALEASFRALE